MNIVNKEFLLKRFPPIKFAFLSNYIVRASRIKSLKAEEKPIVDTIIVCENINEWHKINYRQNKKHYPLISKFTSYKLVTYFQRKGAKIHFNYFKMDDGNVLRYGVVSWEDFLKDLNNWKTLTVSTYMHKPFEIIIDNLEVDNHRTKNLISALCISSLYCLGEGKNEFVVPELEFYDKIIKIPFIQGSYLKIFDDKAINFEIKEIIEDFRQMYLPIIKNLRNNPAWEEYIKFDDRNFNFIIKNNVKAKKFFLDNLNIQIFREISKISHSKLNFFILVPDSIEDKIAEKANSDEKSKNKLLYKLNNIETISRINKGINIILKKHKNTKIFLILMSKWFFFSFLLFKYIIKGLIIFAIYKYRYINYLKFSGNLHIPFISKH